MLTKEEEAWWKDLKKGDYIVCTGGSDSMIPFNYIFKTNHGNIKTYGLITDLNGNADGYVGTNEKTFRPATPEEIKMYEHAGKPVNVTTYKIPVSTKLTKEDLVEGDIYYKKVNSTEWVFDYVSNSPYKCDNTFVNSNSRFGNKNGHIKVYNSSPDRLATPEEKQWLNVCIAENKFIEKDYALRGYDMYGKALKFEVIPEYVECTKYVGRSNEYKVGKVYKVEDGGVRTETGYLGMIKLPVNLTNHYGNTDFKPSTKEAYEAQQEFVLPEKWCIRWTTTKIFEAVNDWAEKDWGWYKDSVVTYNKEYISAPEVIPEKYTEITFEQFKKYVLKEEAPVEPETVESKSEEKSMKAIIIENEEQWNFALNRIRRGKNFYEKPNSYATECMNSISGEFGNIKYYKERGDEVITFDQWCKEEDIDNPFTKKMKDEFVVGKWYKNLGGGDHVGKLCSEVTSTKFPCKEYIYSETYYSTGNYFDTFKDAVEASYEDYGKYLPDGHIDKVMKEEFKVGDWVVIKNAGFVIAASVSLGEVVRISSFDKIGSYDWYVQFDGGGEGGYYKNYPITDYIRKATPEEIAKVTGKTKYFYDLSQHIGRYIKALVDYPNGGGVKKGEIGKILDEGYANFPSQSHYACGGALTEFNKGKYELLPESYSPEVKSDNMEDLLEEAKRRFPVGCTYIAINWQGEPTNGVFEVKDETYIPYKYNSESIALKEGYGLVYANGKWAKIISSPKESVKGSSLPTDEELLEYANKHYYEGVKFISHITDNSQERRAEYYKISSFGWEINGKLGIRTVRAGNGMKWDKDTCSNPSIYSDTDGWCKITYSPVKEEKTTNHQFKVGDEVFLPQYGLGMFNDSSKESKDWALTDGIPLNTKLIIRNVSANGNICFLDYKYNHPASKFKPISELNKQAVYDPGEWGWKVDPCSEVVSRPYDWTIHTVYSVGADPSNGANIWRVPISEDLSSLSETKQDVISPILFKVKEI